MLVVDVYTLVLIYTLNFLQQVLVYTFNTVKSQDVMRIQRTTCDVSAGIDVVVFLDCKSCTLRNYIYIVFSFVTSDSNFRLVV